MPNPPEIQHAGSKAFYSAISDRVTMPPRNLFTSAEEYAASLFHELAHASGAAKRLNRPSITKGAPFGSAVYSQEELIAEMGAAFLCAEAGISPAVIDNQAAYVAGWLKKLRDDRTLLTHAPPTWGFFQAAAQAHAYAFGAFRNQNAAASDVVPASSVTVTSLAFLKIASELKARRFHPGILVFGMKDGMVKVVLNPKLESRIPTATLERARKAEQQFD